MDVFDVGRGRVSDEGGHADLIDEMGLADVLAEGCRASLFDQRGLVEGCNEGEPADTLNVWFSGFFHDGW